MRVVCKSDSSGDGTRLKEKQRSEFLHSVSYVNFYWPSDCLFSEHVFHTPVLPLLYGAISIVALLSEELTAPLIGNRLRE